ncbi:MAG: GNAT family N-acetyltransferase [Bacteroidales bacterium]|nr:GNAT family N-acetyltransferase [Bacteroidales bacterium]
MDIKIRPYRKEDKKIVTEMLIDHSFRGKATEEYSEDIYLIKALYVDYYLNYEPESTFVADSDGEIVGFIMGCANSDRYMRIVMKRLMPIAILKIFFKIITFQYRKKYTYENLWWYMAKSQKEMPPVPSDEYPAHQHMIIAEKARGRGTFKMLRDALFNHLREQGVHKLHSIGNEPVGVNALERYCRVMGYKVHSRGLVSIWKSVSDVQWEMKVFTHEF